MFEFIDYNDIIRQLSSLNSTTSVVTVDSNDNSDYGENDVPVSR
jgi:hypothetical protein